MGPSRAFRRLVRRGACPPRREPRVGTRNMQPLQPARGPSRLLSEGYADGIPTDQNTSHLPMEGEGCVSCVVAKFHSG
jgi:hypothetical protein